MSTSVQQLAIEGVYNDLVSLVPGTIGGTFGGVALAAADVYKLRVVTSRKPSPIKRYPAIVCGVPIDLGEQQDGGLNQTEDIGYPVGIGMFAPALSQNEGVENFALDDDSDLFFTWRDVLLRRYHNKTPSAVSTAVSTCFECRAQPGPILDGEQWNQNVMASWIVVYVMCRRERA